MFRVLDLIVTELVNPTTLSLKLVTENGVVAERTLTALNYTTMLETVANDFESISTKCLAVETLEGKQRIVNTRSKLFQQVGLVCDQLMARNAH